jgi:YfiH family protein
MFQYHFFDKKTGLNDKIFEISKANRVKQTHSNKVVEVNVPQTEWIEADGIVTRTPNLPIGVITADCVPVLFYGDDVVGCAHAGWQGALGGILENVVRIMDTNSIKAFIGPSIQQSSYEVSIGFEKPFIKHDRDAEQFFVAGKTIDKLQFDLSGYCSFRLKQCGVVNIETDKRDTLTDRNFHSHRGGANHLERNLSAIMLR